MLSVPKPSREELKMFLKPLVGWGGDTLSNRHLLDAVNISAGFIYQGRGG